MDTIFTVKNEDLEHLNPQEAVDFFRELLWAEARRIGVPISKIHVSSWINVPDGGIDALVEKNTVSGQSDLIVIGRTSYQIKAGTSFEPWQNAQTKKELFGKESPIKENLGSSIKDCLDKNGTYVLVCFKQDPTDEQHRQAVKILEDYFKLCGYQSPKVQVWSQNNLIGFLKPFPSLALRIKGLDRSRFQSHRSWSENDDMKKGFVAGEKQREFISNLQTALRQENNEAMHIRIFGEPGIGKTRLVFEVTRADDLLPLVIYVDSANKFRDSDLMTEILREDNQFSVILVIDECDSESRSDIWNKLKYRGPRIKIISIYNECDDTSGNIAYFDIPPLEEEQISKIIQEYHILKDQADRWSELCSGSPRVANVIGFNLKTNPEDLLKSPDTVNVWDRYIVGSDDQNNPEVRRRCIVLRHLALFKRIGYGRPVVNEAQAIAKIIERADPQITWSKFQEIIKKLKAWKILQGEKYPLYHTQSTSY